MSANKPESARTLKSDIRRVDSHKIRASEFEDLPELTKTMLKRGTVKRAGRPLATDPRHHP